MTDSVICSLGHRAGLRHVHRAERRRRGVVPTGIGPLTGGPKTDDLATGLGVVQSNPIHNFLKFLGEVLACDSDNFSGKFLSQFERRTEIESKSTYNKGTADCRTLGKLHSSVDSKIMPLFCLPQ